MKDGNMNVYTALKRLYKNGKGQCYSCDKTFRKTETYTIIPNESKNKNFLADGKMWCDKCYGRGKNEKSKI